ncbi:MAG TPA: ABC transporter substrate-binding protein, partial [Acetobacteraceae bacterium]|nr:ABC transporter substrate-binding protein [Acetobacteraceae bacterium]
MRRILLAAACAMAVLPFAKSIPAAAQSAPPTGTPTGTLHIGLREDPDILDPTLGSSYVGRIVFAGMCDKLFDLSPSLKIVPQLATGYTYKDPTHLIIHLRKGVIFQDGEKFDAAAVKYKLMRDLTIKGSMRAGQINAIKSIDIIDPLTVELVLSHPSSPLLAQLAGRPGIMIAPKAAEKEGRNFGLHPVCAGPFSFVSRVAQDKIVLKRFPGYWNAKAIHFARVVYEPITNPAVRLADLQAGALDLVEYIVPTDVAAIQHDAKLKLAMDNSLAYEGITFNTGNGPDAKSVIGQSALVRRAFQLAIDRKALIQVVYNGMYAPTAQANPPASPYYIKSVQPLARNIAKAKALLKKAGVKLPVPVTLTIPTSPDLQQAGQVVQSMEQEAGFNVKIRAMEFASSLQAGYHGNFQAYMIGWSGRSDPDGNMSPFLHTGATFNYGHYSNPAMNKLLDD